MPYQVSKARFAELVEQAIRELPEPFARFMEEVRIEIEDRPSRKLLREMGMDEDELLLGLYEGRSLIERSVDRLRHAFKLLLAGPCRSPHRFAMSLPPPPALLQASVGAFAPNEIALSRSTRLSTTRRSDLRETAALE